MFFLKEDGVTGALMAWEADRSDERRSSERATARRDVDVSAVGREEPDGDAIGALLKGLEPRRGMGGRSEVTPRLEELVDEPSFETVDARGLAPLDFGRSTSSSSSLTSCDG